MQASRDPLRGNLFENMAMMEALKQRYNRGMRSNIFFYRESNGNEVDLVAENGRELRYSVARCRDIRICKHRYRNRIDCKQLLS